MTDQPDNSVPAGKPWAIPHDLDNFFPTPSDMDGIDVVQFFLGWFSEDVPDNGLIARTENDDFTIRRLVHSYEKVVEVFNEAKKAGGPHEDGFYADVLAHAIYLAEGLTFLSLQFKAELEKIIDEDNEPWKNGGDA